MDRRRFMLQASATAAATAMCSLAKAQSSPAASAQLTLSEEPAAPQVPLTYTGLSYELAQLTDPQFFSAANHDLIAYFRLLRPHGVLRLAGEVPVSFAGSRRMPPRQRLRCNVPSGDLAANWMPHRLFAISPEAIDELAGFLQATDGADLRSQFRQQYAGEAALEAAYVAQKSG